MNGLYLGTPDGTGAWTECLATAARDVAVIGARFDPTRRGRGAFLLKMGYEIAFQRHSARLRLHPYTAAALDRRGALVVLDGIGSAGNATGWHPWLVRRSIQLADRLATISHAERERLEQLHRRAFAVLTPFPHPWFFTTPRVPYPQAQVPTLRVGYWGGWHERKGIAELLREVQPSPGVRYYITGPARAEFADRRDITWTGYLARTDLIALIDSLHVALYPSTDEGFGLPPYEALLRGRPVIVRPLPSYRDYLVEERSLSGIFPTRHRGDVPELIARAAGAGESVDPVQALQTPDLHGAYERLRHQVEQWLAD